MYIYAIAYVQKETQRKRVRGRELVSLQKSQLMR